MSERIKRVTDETFKSLLKSGSEMDTVALVKNTTTSSDAADVGDLRLEWIISTNEVDRSGDTIDVNGWSFDNWVKGGSILYAHNPWDLPIAKPDKDRPVWVEGNTVRSIAVYPSKDEYAFGHTVYLMSKAGFIRGASVGFKPKRWEEVTDRPGFMPLDFKEQDLLEWSETPIPDNPGALQAARSMGIDVAPMRDWASKCIDMGDSLLYTREDLERTYFAAGENKTVVDMKVDAKAELESTETESTETKTTSTAEELAAKVKPAPEVKEDGPTDDVLSALSSLASAVETLAQRIDALEQAASDEGDDDDESDNQGTNDNNANAGNGLSISNHVGQLVTRVFHSEEVKRVMAKYLLINGGH